MVNFNAPFESLDNLSWLTDVQEVSHPLTKDHPLVVTQYSLKSGGGLPGPSVPHAETHPFCEISINLQGEILQYIGTERIQRTSGDIMLIGPGIPHYAMHYSYPQRGVTLHFMPMMLFEMGPEGDGARALARFTSTQRIYERSVSPPSTLRKKLIGRFQEMAIESKGKRLGSELRLRALLLDVVTDLLRWEEELGRKSDTTPMNSSWAQVEKTLKYIHTHYSEPLYVEQIARANGLSVSRLQAMFHEVLGMSCVQYLRSYRISNATAMLCSSATRVTDVALSVGFETLSHFNTSFRTFMGMSPTEYMRKHGNRNETALKR